MTYGLKPTTIQAIQDVFANYPLIDKAILYGSRAKGNYRNGSDIDLVLEGLDLDLSLQFKIENELDDLLLPYKIDLSIYHKIENQDLLKHIERVGKVFYDISEWKETTLADLCEDISYGYTESAKQEKIGPKFLRITDIANGRLNWDKVPYCPISDDNFEKYRLLPGNIVIARTGATTGANYTIKTNDPKNVVYASYLIRYKIDKNLANPFYIGQLLRSPSWNDYVDAIAGGSAQPGANAKQLGSYEILIPSLSEQNEIADVLSSLDNKIDLLHRQNKTLEQMAEVLFRQWFVEEASEDWGSFTIADFADHIKHHIKPQSEPIIEFYHYSLPAFDDGQRPAKELGQEIRSNKYLVQPRTILVSKLNPRFPRVWAIPEDIHENSVCSTEFQVFKPKDDIFYEFLIFLFKSEQSKSQLTMAASGTSGSHQRVRPQDILNLEITLPNLELAIKFSKTVRPLILKQQKNQKQIFNLENLRDTLLPKLMSGEVKVSES